MTLDRKVTLSRALAYSSVPAAAFCMYELWSSLGTTTAAKVWFALLMLVVIVALPTTLAFYYYRDQLKARQAASDALTVETLARTAQPTTTAQHASRAESLPGKRRQ